jgi:hypothetical protein
MVVDSPYYPIFVFEEFNMGVIIFKSGQLENRSGQYESVSTNTNTNVVLNF